jgi:hypothetical protein
MLVESNEKMPARVRRAKQDHKASTTQDHPSIFAAILGSPLPEVEKTDRRPGGEDFSMVSAGTETTAASFYQKKTPNVPLINLIVAQWTLTVTTFYLLNQPETLARLSKELQDANAINLSWSALDKPPYPNAVISEALRLSYGVTARIPRIAPNENLVYRGRFNGREIEYVIPSGTAMGMSNAINHHNEDVFPETDTFKPDRWLGLQGAQRRRMEPDLSFQRQWTVSGY